MHSNLSLILNIVLLIAVFIAIGRMVKKRRDSNVVNSQPSIGSTKEPFQDDIISIRKVDSFMTEEELPSFVKEKNEIPEQKIITPLRQQKPMLHSVPSSSPRIEPSRPQESEPMVSIMMFLLAKENRQLAGYELLQTVLAAGLRFGEGQLFHRHQSPNGQGPVLCSLAAATPSGVFDLQNIGAFSVHGLCLFMHACGNPTIDAERFAIMLDTAKQLSEGLDTHLLDDRKRTLSDQSIERYYRLLHLNELTETEPA